MTSRIDVLGDVDLPEGISWLLDELDSNGWIVRGRMGSTGVRVWPDNERKRQIIVGIRYPLNEHRLEEYREHTGLILSQTPAQLEPKGVNDGKH